MSGLTDGQVVSIVDEMYADEARAALNLYSRIDDDSFRAFALTDELAAMLQSCMVRMVALKLLDESFVVHERRREFVASVGSRVDDVVCRYEYAQEEGDYYPWPFRKSPAQLRAEAEAEAKRRPASQGSPYFNDDEDLPF